MDLGPARPADRLNPPPSLTCRRSDRKAAPVHRPRTEEPIDLSNARGNVPHLENAYYVGRRRLGDFRLMQVLVREPQRTAGCVSFTRAQSVATLSHGAESVTDGDRDAAWVPKNQGSSGEHQPERRLDRRWEPPAARNAHFAPDRLARSNRLGGRDRRSRRSRKSGRRAVHPGLCRRLTAGRRGRDRPRIPGPRRA